jgi:hypothetical protein
MRECRFYTSLPSAAGRPQLHEFPRNRSPSWKCNQAFSSRIGENESTMCPWVHFGIVRRQVRDGPDRPKPPVENGFVLPGPATRITTETPDRHQFMTVRIWLRSALFRQSLTSSAAFIQFRYPPTRDMEGLLRRLGWKGPQMTKSRHQRWHYHGLTPVTISWSKDRCLTEVCFKNTLKTLGMTPKEFYDYCSFDRLPSKVHDRFSHH